MTLPPDPTELWQSLEQTDPAYCKEFQRPGGFRGTAIDPMWRAKRLTEVLGPCGIGWGYEVIDDGIIGDKQPLHWCRIRFWFKWHDQLGEFQGYGCTPVMMKRRDGYIVDDEAPKKSLTDAVFSCASRVGMSADVWLQTHQEDKYRPQEPQQAPRRNGAPRVNTAPPPDPNVAQGAGGSQQQCPRCGDQGRTQRFWDPSSRAPDLECAGDCVEEWKGKERPLRWWSLTKGEKANAPAPAPARTEVDDDIPF